MVLRHLTFRKTAEILLLRQERGGFIHPCQFRCMGQLPGYAIQEYLFAEMYVVAVFTSAGMKARMEVAGHCGRADHRDICRQQTIQTVNEWFGEYGRTVKMEREMPGVHTAVGSSATGDRCFLPEQGLKAAFKYALYGWGLGLLLPALICRTTELDIESVTLQLHPAVRSLESFVNDRSTLANAHTHRGHTVARLFALHQVEQGS